MAAADRIRQLPISVSVLVLLLVLLVPAQLHSSDAMSLSGSASSSRNLMGGSTSNANTNRRNSNQIPKCNDMSSATLCSQNPKCRWCRSAALDDMCFSKAEAFRLPLEVFSCS